MAQLILIPGGTNFIGSILVERLQEFPQYELSLFNRQRTAPGLFPGVKSIKGERGT
jgi:2'-hydroxyisoflavone reductase